MCLAIPGKLIEISTDANGVRMGRANFGGIVKQVCLEYTPEVKNGDYVLVHVGFALSKVDEAEAVRTYQALARMEQLTELDIPDVTEDGAATKESVSGNGKHLPDRTGAASSRVA
jgi:hydrogenase expression/formation protein HypC